jgi:hypothetical protein
VVQQEQADWVVAVLVVSQALVRLARQTRAVEVELVTTVVALVKVVAVLVVCKLALA